MMSLPRKDSYKVTIPLGSITLDLPLNNQSFGHCSNDSINDGKTQKIVRPIMESHKKHLGFFETKCKTQPDLQEIAMKLPSLNLIPETSKEMDQVLNLTPFQHLWVNIHRVRCFFGKKKGDPKTRDWDVQTSLIENLNISNLRTQLLEPTSPAPRICFHHGTTDTQISTARCHVERGPSWWLPYAIASIRFFR